ncbi:hypothetical protein PP298_15555 [Mycobacteroides abscessus]|uniref:hypothetical protein n=1 Tax=Mycobacteroides abscessus TaxID=36809 RepID=UPI00078B7EDB|nr:hypothetical protein [Mycobacteroides abscessus]AMU70634.1 hypothetical protein A3O05_11695 [Mycobacteroides abscessus]MDM2016773.1 hypothetical protein [Mycobacteroides abscessus]MDM2020645.1 hypothetical protein [Mycobacteroides abscessus]MDM2025458.1 hypothetical protein [Mycobacteroides abscessus]MDM2029057.1 hypothetical protein [Mycobacteroides abscessus]
MAATSLVREHHVGVVYTVDASRRNMRYQDPLEAIAYTRERAPDAEILLDCNLYSGRNRKVAAGIPGRLSPEWIAFQRGLGLKYALTDSGYIGAGRVGHLSATLRAGTRLGSNVLTALPLDARWLTHDADALCDKVSRYGTPVALMIEDEADPFDRKYAAQALTNLIATGVPVSLLRADTSALGAIAHGAAIGAVGSKSSLRHFYPIPKNENDHPDPNKDYLSFVIPELLGYFLNEKFQNAYDIDSSNPAWRCGCSYCHGAALTWISEAGHDDIPQASPVQLGFELFSEHEEILPVIRERVPPRRRDPRSDAAFVHSVASIAAFGQRLVAIAEEHNCAPASAWSLMCERSQLQHDTIKTNNEKAWKPRPAFRRWRDLATVPLVLPPHASSPERAQRESPPNT